MEHAPMPDEPTEHTQPPSPAQGQRPVRAGVIGMGFMGRTHAAGYTTAATTGHPCTLAAVADRNESNLTGTAPASGNLDTDNAPEQVFDPARVQTFTDAADMLAAGVVDAVSVCTHTDTHVRMGTMALEAGAHVLMEKPVALVPDEIRTLRDAALANNRLCIPAMCMRHWPGWTWLKKRVTDGSLGNVLSANFYRLGGTPNWGEGFYTDIARSGGALFDLHVHDTDFVFHCFGTPANVTTTGSLAHPTTTYHYEDGFEAVAEGSWEQADSDPFVMRFEVRFADATADFDLSREDAPLLLRRGTDAEPVALPPTNGWQAEIAAFIDTVARFDPEAADLSTPLDEAIAVTELLLAERASLESGQPVQP